MSSSRHYIVNDAVILHDNLASSRLLIDGDAPANLMVRFNVGVRVARAVEIKRIDLDYFEDVDAE